MFNFLGNLNIINLSRSLTFFSFLKLALILFLIGFIIFQIIISKQISSMEKIVIQPMSSAILNLISLSFIILAVLILIFTFTLHVK